MAGSVPKTVGELELSKLLSSLEAVLDPELYVFVTLPLKTSPPVDLAIQMLFQEREGLTVIATKKSSIDHGLSYTFPCRMITLDVHSSLEAVGFIAVIATELKKLKIGVNPVSGYFHDHLFIPDGKEKEVMAKLKDTKQRAKSTGLYYLRYDVLKRYITGTMGELNTWAGPAHIEANNGEAETSKNEESN